MVSLKEMINVAEREGFTEIGFPLKTDSIKPIFLNFENKGIAKNFVVCLILVLVSLYGAQG